MADIFIVENGIVKPTIEILLVSPFKEIWDRDSSESKEYAMKEFSYIYFITTPKKTNPFYGYTEQDRHPEVVKYLFENYYSPDSIVQQAMEVRRKFYYEASASLSLLEGAKEAVDKLKNFLINFDLNERNEKGIPIYKPKDITSALADTFNVMKTLNSLEEKVNEEIYESAKSKGNRDINPFER
jgi:hypothetical protein